MKKITLLFSTFFCLVYYSKAQEKYEFLGGLILNDTLTISYRLNLEENEGELTGFSVSDIGGLYETKSIVKGNYNTSTKQLFFSEVETIYTKTPLEKDYEFCYVNATIPNFILGKTEKVNTNFKGVFSDSVECVSGKLLLNSVEKIKERMQKVAKKIEKIKKIPDSIKQEFREIKVMDSLQINFLKSDQTMSFFSKNQRIKLTVYDAGKEDGDIIKIAVNGVVLHEKLLASNTKRDFFIDLKTPKSTIVITAIGEGKIAPNTVVVELDDNNNKVKALSNLKNMEETKIDILRQDF